jgi:hypothetical protein
MIAIPTLNGVVAETSKHRVLTKLSALGIVIVKIVIQLLLQNPKVLVGYDAEVV